MCQSGNSLICMLLLLFYYKKPSRGQKLVRLTIFLPSIGKAVFSNFLDIFRQIYNNLGHNFVRFKVKKIYWNVCNIRLLQSLCV